MNNREQLAFSLIKLSSETSPVSADELLPNSGLSGFLGNAVWPWQTSRSGKATQLAEAIDEEPSFSLRRPLTHALAHSVPGSLLGALLGASAGSLLSRNGDNVDKGFGTFLGAQAGSVLGSLGGSTLAALAKGRAIDKLKAKYSALEEKPTESNYDEQVPDYSIIKSTMLPLSGQFRRGRKDMEDALLTNQPVKGRSGLNTVEALLGSLIDGGLISGITENLVTNDRNKALRKSGSFEKEAATKGVKAFGNLTKNIGGDLWSAAKPVGKHIWKHKGAYGGGLGTTAAGFGAGGLYAKNRMQKQMQNKFQTMDWGTRIQMLLKMLFQPNQFSQQIPNYFK